MRKPRFWFAGPCLGLLLSGGAFAAAPRLPVAAPAEEAPFTEENPARRDSLVTCRARQALQQDGRLAPLNLGVSVRSGIAVLWGSVPSAGLARRAEENLRRVPGVLRVRSEIQVLPADDPLNELLSRPRTQLPTPLPPVPEALLAPALLTSRWIDGATALPAAERRPWNGVSLLPPIVPEEPETAGDLALVLERLCQADAKYRGLRAELNGGVVRLGGAAQRAEHVMELAQKISLVPGVERVILQDVSYGPR